MNRPPDHDRLRYLAAFLLPMLLLALALAAASLFGYQQLKTSTQGVERQIHRHLGHITEAVAFSDALDRTNAEFQALLEDARARPDASAAGPDQRIARLDVQLATLARRLDALGAWSADTASHAHAVDDFQAYRTLVMASLTAEAGSTGGAHDVARIDLVYHDLSLHVNALVALVSADASQATSAHVREIDTRIERSLELSLLVITLAVALTIALAHRLSGHLRMLAQALGELARDELAPPELIPLRQLGAKKGSQLSALAAAVLKFRDTRLAQKDSEHLLRTVIEEAPCAIEVVDPDTLGFLQTNAYTRRTLGYSEAELRRMTVADIQGELPPARLALLVQEILEKRSVEFETVHRCADGRLFDASVRIRAIKLNGKDYLLGIWQDVSGERQTLQALKKFSLAIEQSPNAVIITDIDARIEYVNDAFVHKTGYPREDAMGRNPRFLKSGKTPPEVYADMWSTLTRGEAWRGELSNRTRGGSEQVERAVITPLRQADGRITHYVAVKEDITAEKKKNAELLRLFTAVEQSPDSIVITDLDARIEYVNQAFVDTTGYSREEAIGQNPRVLQTGKTSKQIYREMWESLTRGIPWRGELLNKRKDGSEYIELAHIAPIRQPDGRVTHYLAIKQNITEKRRLVEELERHRHHLEQLVDERSAELVAARDAADVANRAKSEFLANMSHEIRTPLNAIIGLSHLLAKDLHDSAQQARLSKISGAAKHLLQIINDILDLSKIEAGRLDLEANDFDPARMVMNAVELVREQAGQKDLAIVLELDALPPRVHGDALRLGQIVLNFASNAVKFTAHGQVLIRARILSAQGKDLLVRFEVSDTGIGMDEAQCSRLFQPFEQADRSTTRKYGGTGLGLAISRRLTELMGGRIGVDSVAGTGSTFWIEVPLELRAAAQASLQDAPRAVIERPAGCTREGGLAGVHILLAEDNPINREVAVAILSAAGARIDTAENGQEAVEKALASRYDLILMDMQMPVMDGLAATRLLRSRRELHELPILAMTANAFAEDRQLCIDAGMNDHIAKPVEPAILCETITRWLPLTPPAHALPPAAEAAPPALAAADGDDAAFARLAGVADLDVDVGLKYALGERSFYLDLLEQYADGDYGSVLLQALEAGDTETLHRTAHSLKAVAATIGASALRHAAAAADSLLASAQRGPQALAHDVSVRAAITALAARSTRLGEALRVITRERHPGPVELPQHASAPAAAVDPTQVAEVLANLDHLLTLGDLGARELLGEHRELLRAELGEHLHLIEDRLSIFAFDEALADLHAAIASRTRSAPA
jgi:PAS domain S-box-containing protein